MIKAGYSNITKIVNTLFLSVFVGILYLSSFGTGIASDFGKLPVKGKVTMIGFGINLCIPCREMARVIEKLKLTFGKNVAFFYIEKWSHPDLAERFNVKLVPTQLLFNKEGVEVHRHVDVMDEAEIIRLIKQFTTH